MGYPSRGRGYSSASRGNRRPDGGARTGAVVAVAVAVAAGWRSFYLLRLHSSPLADLLEMDSRIYWEWATTLLRDGWVGSRQFFMGGLYPYFIAVVRTVTGHSVLAMQVLQCLMSVATIGLLTQLVTRLYGWRWGLGMGCLLAGYGPWIFLDGQILMEPLLLALQAVWLLLLIADWERPNSVCVTAALGGLVGLMALARGSNLLLAIPTAVWLLRAAARGRRHVLLMTLVIGATALPTTIRSLVIGREWIPYTYGLGYNFFVGNGEGATGVFRTPPRGAYLPPDPVFEGGAIADGRDILRERLGSPLSPGQSSAMWFRLGIEGVLADPGRWVALLGWKIVLLVNRQEATQIQSPHAFNEVAGPMGWGWVGGFALLGVIGLAGILLGAATGGMPRLLVIAWGCLALAPVLFFVTDRYRIHLIPIMVLLAPLGLQGSLKIFSTRGTLRRITAAIPMSLSALIVFYPVVNETPAKRRFDVATTLAGAYLQQEREGDALRALEQAIAIDRAYSLPGAETPAGRAARADVYARRAALAMNQGRWTLAIDDLHIAIGLDPSRTRYARDLSIALAADGRLESALRLMPADAISRAALREEIISRIRESESQRRLGALEGYLMALNAAAPHWEPAVVALVRHLIVQGRVTAAEVRLERELVHGLRRSVYQVHLAAVRLREGKPSKSQELLRAIPDEARTRDPVVAATMKTFGLVVD